MYLLTYLLVLSVFGLIALFVFQLWQLRAGRIERLPNITGAHVVGPLARFLARWVVLVRKQVQVFSYPLLMVFYQGLLQLLLRLPLMSAQQSLLLLALL